MDIAKIENLPENIKRLLRFLFKTINNATRCFITFFVFDEHKESHKFNNRLKFYFAKTSQMHLYTIGYTFNTLYITSQKLRKQKISGL